MHLSASNTLNYLKQRLIETNLSKTLINNKIKTKKNLTFTAQITHANNVIS